MVSTSTYLDGILAAHRAVKAVDDRDLDVLIRDALASPPPRPFMSALEAGGAELSVIAEIKRRSPSKGQLDLNLDPTLLAAQYAAGGAACVSVLTDAEFFGGSPQDLVAAKASCELPVLRKDFTVGPKDVADTRLMGADAVLLIVAALNDAELAQCSLLAEQLGLTALVEVHDELELDRAMAAGAKVIGVNQRDLFTFEVDHDRAVRVAAAIPDSVLAVAESGVRDADDASRLAEAGYKAVLVGESLLRSQDRVASVSALTGHRVGTRSKKRSGAEAEPPSPDHGDNANHADNLGSAEHSIALGHADHPSTSRPLAGDRRV